MILTDDAVFLLLLLRIYFLHLRPSNLEIRAGSGKQILPKLRRRNFIKPCLQGIWLSLIYFVVWIIDLLVTAAKYGGTADDLVDLSAYSNSSLIGVYNCQRTPALSISVILCGLSGIGILLYVSAS
jgi:hypothetical protein